jgi:L-fuconolactonase
MNGIIDSHVHLYDPAMLEYGWMVDRPDINRRHAREEIEAAVSGSDVCGVVFAEVDVAPDRGLAEVAWVSSIADGLVPVLGIVAFAPIDDGSLEEYLDALSEYPLVCGVRKLIERGPVSLTSTAAYHRGLRKVAARGLPFDLCPVRDQLRGVIDLVTELADAPFILDHLGKPAIADGEWEPWASQLRELGLRDNLVAAKLSGLMTEAGDDWTPERIEPYLRHAIEVFGPDRLMIGSDWPIFTDRAVYADWLSLLDRVIADLSQDEQTAIRSGTAERVYGLQTPRSIIDQRPVAQRARR